jgi:hypothetical protein
VLVGLALGASGCGWLFGRCGGDRFQPPCEEVVVAIEDADGEPFGGGERAWLVQDGRVVELDCTYDQCFGTPDAVGVWVPMIQVGCEQLRGDPVQWGPSEPAEPHTCCVVQQRVDVGLTVPWSVGDTPPSDTACEG